MMTASGRRRRWYRGSIRRQGKWCSKRANEHVRVQNSSLRCMLLPVVCSYFRGGKGHPPGSLVYVCNESSAARSREPPLSRTAAVFSADQLCRMQEVCSIMSQYCNLIGLHEAEVLTVLWNFQQSRRDSRKPTRKVKEALVP